MASSFSCARDFRWRTALTTDYVIAERAESAYAGYVYLSRFVLMRICHWNLDPVGGFKCIEALHRAVERGNRVRLGTDKLPITEPEWTANKREGVAELRRAFKQYRRVFNQSRVAPTYQEACDWFRKTVHKSDSFPFLSMNVDSLFGYLDDAAIEDPTIKGRFTLGTLKAADLFHAWAITFRQSISNLQKV